jgi:hypothetical protein
MRKPSYRTRLAVGGGVLVLLAYAVAAVTVLPEWVVSSGHSSADAAAKLNAITTTRVALLGVLTPVVVIIGGVVAGLSYGETVRHNRRSDESARRLRRAEVYVELLTACDECVTAADEFYHLERMDQEEFSRLRAEIDTTAGMAGVDERVRAYRSRMDALMYKRLAMERVADRVTLLGSDEVQPAASALALYIDVEITTNAAKNPKLPEEEWRRIRITDFAPIYKAFLAVDRSDLTPSGN